MCVQLLGGTPEPWSDPVHRRTIVTPMVWRTEPRASHTDRGQRTIRMLVWIVLLIAVSSCADFSSQRRGESYDTLGNAIYQALCDRVGAQSLGEDLSGGSYHRVCHPDAQGHYADKVDRTQLPGAPAGFAALTRELAIGKVEALARRRAELVQALDATFADVPVGKSTLHAALSDFMADNKKLYDEGTVPDVTRALGRFSGLTHDSSAAALALARLAARKGYRPYGTELGPLGAVLSYPKLTELTRAGLAPIAPYSDPADESSAAGPAYDRLTALMDAAAAEMRTADATPPDGAVREIAPGVISRPRSTAELLYALSSHSDPSLEKAAAPIWLVRRDERGLALLAAPILDENHDGLEDVDALGFPVDSSGARRQLPSPFVALSVVDGPRDAEGRALDGSGKQLWQTFDGSQTLGAALVRDLSALAAPRKGEPSDLTAMLLGAMPLLGKQGPAHKAYTAVNGKPAVTLDYTGYQPDTSPLLALGHAAAMLLGDPRSSDLLELSAKLMQDHPHEVARVVGAMLEINDLAKQYPDAKLPADSMFWDDVLDVLEDIARVPGLLDDVLRSAMDPDTLLGQKAFPAFMTFSDRMTYNPPDLNGAGLNLTLGGTKDPATPVDRTKPITGDNRSLWFRQIEMLDDMRGVAMCNKENAIVHGKDLPGIGDHDYPDGQIVFGPIHACQVFRVDDVASLFLDSIGGLAHIPVRDPAIAAGTTDHVQEVSSGITGMTLHPTPQALSRFTSFDFLDDTDPSNALTRNYMKDLIDPPPTSGCSVTPVTDPYDGSQVPLRTCKDPSQRFWNRYGQDTALSLERFGFLEASRPLAHAFAVHGRSDLLARLFDVLFQHWGDGSQSAAECDPAAKPGEHRYCTGDGLVRYEPLIAKALAGDLLPALHDLTLATAGVTVDSHVDGAPVDGIRVLAEALRGAIDPDLAKARGVTDLAGNATAKRNDGTVEAQVTPLRLLIDAIKSIDTRFDDYQKAHPGEPDRHALWKRARSALVDRFLAVDASGASSSFKNPATPITGAVFSSLVREQIDAHCPGRLQTPPVSACKWTDQELTENLRDALGGPLSAGAAGVGDAILSDDAARAQIEAFVAYLVDPQGAGFRPLVASVVDGPAGVNDGSALAPLLQAAAPLLERSPDQSTAYAAILRLLARVAGDDVDPDRVMQVVLRQLVTPMGKGKPAPLDVFVDVLGDVERYDSRLEPGAPLDRHDVTVASDSVKRLMLDPARGLEQFYEVIRDSDR
jgi:hypothetical protein